ncbi:hypothetical protein NEOKW01_1874 [Nematocida sp. AWRm80]|nr:hypothetical protein NEOKW01_1874 [Nematocida sp. AWRm80]
MDFSSTENEEDKMLCVPSPGRLKILSTLPIAYIVTICITSISLRKVLENINDRVFVPREYPSTYNIYVKEKQQVPLGNNLLEQVFYRLIDLGINCRLIISIPVSHSPKVSFALEIIMGDKVIAEGIREKGAVILSVDPIGRILNHSVAIPSKVSRALNQVIESVPERHKRDLKASGTIDSLNTEDNTILQSEYQVDRIRQAQRRLRNLNQSEITYLTDRDEKVFFDYDTKQITRLPQTKKEALLHPLYRIDPGSKRTLVHPKGVGWVGHIQSKHQKNRGKSKSQKEKELRLYPVSHIHRLLSLSEITRKHKQLVPDTRPFRKLSPTSRYPNGINLYAPWQIENIPIDQTITQTPNTIIVPREIPSTHIYLLETRHFTYSTLGIGTVPRIGYRYNHITQSRESVVEGLLLSKEEYQKNKRIIIDYIHSQILSSLLAPKSTLLLNIHLFYAKLSEYIRVLENINEDR